MTSKMMWILLLVFVANGQAFGVSMQNGQNGQNGELKKIRHLIQLQRTEQQLGQKRLTELGHTITELETRQVQLKEKHEAQRKALWGYLRAIEASLHDDRGGDTEQKLLEAPRQKVLANLVDRGLKELAILRADLQDTTHLEAQIQEEKMQVTALFQNLKEQEGVLELNYQLQLDLLKKKVSRQKIEFDNYRKLKTAESQVERLIGNFNAKKELEKEVMFLRLKGKLPFPLLGGKVVSEFGKVFDQSVGLYVFKKGIEILPAQDSHDTAVRAIFDGKVVFSGHLPNYGQVVILDHGNHYYSLCGHLGNVVARVNQRVKAGDSIGEVRNSGIPIYFEIRARNIAVNPLQWLYN